MTSEDWLKLFEAEGLTAAIFDCDGTLLKSMDAQFCAMQAAAQEQGFEMSLEWYSTRSGLDRRSLFRALNQHRTGVIDIDRVVTSSIACFPSFAHLIKPIPVVLDFADTLWRRGIPLAVGTNSERPVAEVSLSTTGVDLLFDHLVCVSDGLQPKPSPEIFLQAAKRLGQPPRNTLVIEDSPQGVQAAISAEMSAIQLLDDT